MTDKDDKIESINYRINNTSKQITDLEQTKINLMMLKREIQYQETKEVLETAFEKTLNQLTPEEQQKFYKKFEDFS